MERSAISRILGRAALDAEFRQRTLENLGMALAQEGFLLTDGEMAEMRTWWEELQGLSPRSAAERIEALARGRRY